MRRFAALFQALDETTSTSRKVDALVHYFERAPAEDAAWAVYLLTGRRLKRLVPARELRELAAEITGYPHWLIEETYASVGDLAETLALLLDDAGSQGGIDDTPLHAWMGERLPGLRRLEASERRARIRGWWQASSTQGRFVLNKLITGGFRVGVSRRLVVRALAHYSGLDAERIAHRLMGQWEPDAAFFEALVSPEDRAVDQGRPYPFFLASPLDLASAPLGALADWIVEWKWDGIRAQLLRRADHSFIWSRGEEVLDGRFPEIEAAARALPAGCVLDGEIVAWEGDGPLPFARLQRRIGRLRPDARILREAPVVFMAFDLLELDGEDLRSQPLRARRERLHRLLDECSEPSRTLRPSPAVEVDDWDALAALRERRFAGRTEGFLIKRADSPYRVGRVRGDWWKWKVDPRTVDAVLLYAEPGHGRRSGLLTDYTFGVWRGDQLVPVAKAYSGLEQAEIEDLDRWIRGNTRERFGPVRSVRPAQVFELGCDGVQRSSRHKAGVTLRFPRIHRWRHDLGIDQADRLDDVERLVDE